MSSDLQPSVEYLNAFESLSPVYFAYAEWKWLNFRTVPACGAAARAETHGFHQLMGRTA